MQRQKTRQSERITPLQSTKTVMRVLQMSFSCIAFLRGFFDDEHFEDSVFVTDDNKTDTGLRIKLIKENKSKEADGLLNWINGAIAESLKEKYLRAINLSIILDPKKPSEIFESYCFQIGYNDKGPSVVFDTDVNINPVKETRNQIHQLLKRFIVITQSLPNLPPKRYLSMQLMFNDNCSKEFCPNRFVDCSNEPPAVLRVPVSRKDQFDVTDCGFMDSYHHQVSTRIMSLATVDLSRVNKRSIIKEIDPFSFLDEETTLVEEEYSKDYNEEMSQITKELNELVHVDIQCSSHAQETQKFQDTQKFNKIVQGLSSPSPPPPPPLNENNNTTINCQCGSNKPLSYSSSIQCTTCHVYKHKACYAIDNNNNSLSTSFKCITCQGGKVTDDVKVILIIRRLLYWLNDMEKPMLISMSNLLKQLGYIYQSGKGFIKERRDTIKLMSNALSVLFHDGIVTLKSRKSFFYVPFEIDFNGVMLNKLPVATGNYFINYSRNNELANKYMESDLIGISKYVEDSIQCMMLDEEEEISPMAEKIDNDVNMAKYLDLSQAIDEEEVFVSRKKRKVSKSIDVFSV